MRENGLRAKNKRRFTVTTDSGHGRTVFPNRARHIVPAGPNQLWVESCRTCTSAFAWLAD